MEVLRSCQSVVDTADFVTVDSAAAKKCAATILEKLGHPRDAYAVWEACPFHIQAEPSEVVARYCFIVNCMNFCFWPSHCEGRHEFEYDDLAGTIADIFNNRPEEMTPSNLANATEETIKSWFHNYRWSGSQQPEGSLPSPVDNLGERSRYVREVGRLLQRYEAKGSSTPTLDFIREAAGPTGDAVALVEAVAANCPGFRDSHVYKGKQIFIYKRAQILVGDLWGAFLRLGADLATNACAFTNMDKLTMFADYRVPQILRAHNVLLFKDAAFEQRIDQDVEILAGSPEEVELRAATVVACHEIAIALTEQYRADVAAGKREAKGDYVEVAVKDIEVDWLFWQLGEAEKNTLPKFHKTRTVFY